MRPVKMFFGLLAGLVLVMFIAKVLFFGLLFALPFGLLYFAAKGLRHHAWERRFNDGYSDPRQHLYTAWKTSHHEPLFYENEKPFEWMASDRAILVK